MFVHTDKHTKRKNKFLHTYTHNTKNQISTDTLQQINKFLHTSRKKQISMQTHTPHQTINFYTDTHYTQKKKFYTQTHTTKQILLQHQKRNFYTQRHTTPKKKFLNTDTHTTPKNKFLLTDDTKKQIYTHRHTRYAKK